jgi:hypothetical protein
MRARRTEYALLAGVVAFAAALRLIGLTPESSPSFHPALGSVLFVEDLLRTSGVSGAVRHWTTLFASVQGLSLIDRSVVAFPPAVLAHVALGPSLALASYLGTFYGLVAVVLAWAAGRAVGGPTLGLLFAALLAVSPVEIVWSRIGGLYIACVPHLLLGILCAQAAARRQSAALAGAAGIIAWFSLYNYYATRLVIPVALGALLFSGVDRRRTPWLVAWFLAPLLLGSLASTGGVVQTLWPTVGGGFLPPAERSPWNLASLAWGRWQNHWLPTLQLVFTAGRTTLNGGGMLPLLVLLLGAGGFAIALAAPPRHAAWLLLAVLGYAMTALSGAEVRRLLPVDLAWNYFAALAVAGLMRSRVFAAVPRTTLAVVLALGLCATGVWSVVAIASLTRRATAELTPIPFGGGQLGEAIMCRPCSTLASYWRDRIREGTLIVLFDHDRARDLRIFRMGLRGYGMLAALDAGKPRYFTTACGDWQWRPASHPARATCRVEPPRLRAHVASVHPAPASVRFHFTAPADDRLLVTALGRLGRTTHPLSGSPHVEITIDASRIAEALDVLDREALPVRSPKVATQLQTKPG